MTNGYIYFGILRLKASVITVGGKKLKIKNEELEMRKEVERLTG
jgi:hypothetical protein